MDFNFESHSGQSAGIWKVIEAMKLYCLYIMSNKSNKVLYTGVTDNLIRRVYGHKNRNRHDKFERLTFLKL